MFFIIQIKKLKKKLMADDIRKMSVAQVRRALHSLRSKWENHAPSNPICLSETLEGNMSLSEFCFVFVVNHHSKRQSQKEESLRLKISKTADD